MEDLLAHLCIGITRTTGCHLEPLETSVQSVITPLTPCQIFHCLPSLEWIYLSLSVYVCNKGYLLCYLNPLGAHSSVICIQCNISEWLNLIMHFPYCQVLLWHSSCGGMRLCYIEAVLGHLVKGTLLCSPPPRIICIKHSSYNGPTPAFLKLWVVTHLEGCGQISGWSCRTSNEKMGDGQIRELIASNPGAFQNQRAANCPAKSWVPAVCMLV